MSRYSDEQRQQVLDKFEESTSSVADFLRSPDALGISRSTLCRWIDEHGMLTPAHRAKQDEQRQAIVDRFLKAAVDEPLQREIGRLTLERLARVEAELAACREQIQYFHDRIVTGDLVWARGNVDLGHLHD